jgi:hypothetical protein
VGIYKDQQPMPKVGEVYHALGVKYLVRFADDKAFVLINEETGYSHCLTKEAWSKPNGWVKVE